MPYLVISKHIASGKDLRSEEEDELDYAAYKV
jgi:hypothetical protein